MPTRPAVLPHAPSPFALLPLAALVLGIVGLAGCNSGAYPAVKGLDTRADGRGFVTRTFAGHDFAVFVPLSYSPARKYPMIVFLHGISEGGSNLRNALSAGLGPFIEQHLRTAGDFDFIVAFPQSRDGSWDVSRDAPTVLGIVNAVKLEFNVDADRVALTGLSTGGYGAWAIGAQFPDVFSAVAPMAANAPFTDQGEALARMNIWAVENASDPFGAAASNQKSIASVVAAGGSPRHTSYPSFAHNCWDQAYAEGEIFAWFRQARRGGGLVPTGTIVSAPAVASRAVADLPPPPAPTVVHAVAIAQPKAAAPVAAVAQPRTPAPASVPARTAPEAAAAPAAAGRPPSPGSVRANARMSVQVDPVRPATRIDPRLSRW